MVLGEVETVEGQLLAQTANKDLYNRAICRC
jgi:hypothetical protein